MGPVRRSVSPTPPRPWVRQLCDPSRAVDSKSAPHSFPGLHPDCHGSPRSFLGGTPCGADGVQDERCPVACTTIRGPFYFPQAPNTLGEGSDRSGSATRKVSPGEILTNHGFLTLANDNMVKSNPRLGRPESSPKRFSVRDHPPAIRVVPSGFRKGWFPRRYPEESCPRSLSACPLRRRLRSVVTLPMRQARTREWPRP
jgi:hypothetical protein